MNSLETQVVFYDTHAHLDYADYAADMEQVLARARAAGVSRIITIGTSLTSSARAIELSERHPEIYAAVAWHPNEADQAPEDIRPALAEMAKHPKVVAIGETGLDYFYLPSARGAGTAEDDLRHKKCQARLFAQHLEVAAEAGLNCVIHQRSALADVLSQLAPFEQKLRVVFHCFGENASVARQLLAKNWLMSFTGIATFKNAQSVREALASIPLQNLMLETDCPYLAPVPNRGKRCEPAFLVDTARVIAQVKQCSMAELATATRANAHEFFRKF
jgi:TatD DNase family protein